MIALLRLSTYAIAPLASYGTMVTFPPMSALGLRL